MVIEIENTSSPGASFTENTNLVLLSGFVIIKNFFFHLKNFA